ncbi:hypothetical protein DVH24_039347 [Malus domestica]|uniref:Uncharacterized protein n=1 Tax=Malus domestica TaxID=3750 RepID=A0A498HVN3_MALDO|nr:hypothetical protein DVH24_039347 [Malus domestica]
MAPKNRWLQIPEGWDSSVSTSPTTTSGDPFWTISRTPALSKGSCGSVFLNDTDLFHPPAELETRKHKLKSLVQTPNSFFMDVKCQGCFSITTVFSHSQTAVVCGNARQCCASLLEVEPGLPRVVFSKEMGTDAGTLIQIAKELCGDDLRSCLPMATIRLPILKSQ